MDANITYPDELYKYRALDGLATYKHIEDNLYEDTTCREHARCRVTVKKDGERYVLDELVNWSAKEYSNMHMPFEGDAYFYTDKESVLRRVLERAKTECETNIEKYRQQLADAENELEIKVEKPREQTIERMNYGAELVLLRNLYRDETEMSVVKYKVSDKDGLRYLITEERHEVRNTTHGKYMEATLEWVEEEYEPVVHTDNYFAFCSVQDYEDYKRYAAREELERNVRILQNAIKDNEHRLEEYKEKLKI